MQGFALGWRSEQWEVEDMARAGSAGDTRPEPKPEALARELTDLRQMRILLEAILRSTQDAISVVDENGLGLFINPAYTRLTGLTEADVIGKPATIDIAEGESMHLRVLRTRQPVRGARLKVGPQRKDVLVHVAPILVEGKLRGSVAVIHDVSEIRRLTEELDMVKDRLRRPGSKYTFDDIVGESPAMQIAIEQARRVADTPATVLLRGASGTGKELFAHAIHNASRRRHHPLIRVNCLALSESLLESELFGYAEGAFTGASKGGKRGLFQEAHGGTLFLDEIGEMNLAAQAKLLRALQEKEILPVGASTPVSVDVRVIAATNRDLEQAVRTGLFREDLYYRLNVVPIYIPPLRQRLEDIPLLVQAMIRKFNQEFGRNVEACSPEALAALQQYSWPGNVRELENVIGRAMLNAREGQKTLEREHLPAFILAAVGRSGKPALVQGPRAQAAKQPQADSGAAKAPVLSLREVRWRAERGALQEALAASGGNRELAAQMLGISLRSLYYKLDRYRLDRLQDV